MFNVTDTAWKFGCGRYIQRADALKELEHEIMLCGNRPFFITGKRSIEAVRAVYPNMKEPEEGHFFQYTGPCSMEMGEKLAALISKGKDSCVVGIGGGKIMDLTKLAGKLAGVRVIQVPTISATCAATTCLSVLYDEHWSTTGSYYYESEVDAVIVDTEILCRQPYRYAAAGILDSMTKACEIIHHGEIVEQKADLYFAYSMAKHIFSRLYAIYPKAIGDIKNNVNSKEVEELAFLTIGATGIVSGTARGSFQTAIAHAVYEEGRKRYPAELLPSLHGEIVGVGMRYQCRYTGRYEKEVEEILLKTDMPRYLRDIGLGKEYIPDLADGMAQRLIDTGKKIDKCRLEKIMFDMENE